MIVTDDDELAETCRSLRNLCFQPQKRFVHERLGWNLRMTNLQAALGLAQLERLDEFAAKKRSMGLKYTEYFSYIPGIQLPVTRLKYAENIYWVYGIVLSKEIGLNAEEAMLYLLKNGIGTRPFFYPMHQQPVLQRIGLFKGESYPVAEYISQQGFYIPSGMALTEQQIASTVKIVKKLLKCN